MASGVVIVGGGQAGFQAAASLRSGGYAEPIRIVGTEPYHPYQRPPLSKSLLLGKSDGPPLFYRQPAFYAAQGIDLLLGERATADRKSTRLNSSHANISYAVFCLKKKKIQPIADRV